MPVYLRIAAMMVTGLLCSCCASSRSIGGGEVPWQEVRAREAASGLPEGHPSGDELELVAIYRRPVTIMGTGPDSLEKDRREARLDPRIDDVLDVLLDNGVWPYGEGSVIYVLEADAEKAKRVLRNRKKNFAFLEIVD